MANIRIKCPTCGKILQLADAPNINKAIFTCPVCQEKHRVGACPRYVGQPRPAAGEETLTGFGGRAGNSEETQIGQPIQGNIGRLVDNIGNTYQLSMGFNTVGRKAATSQAAVQIDTQDRYMSRNHAVIEVREAGGRIFHILKNGTNKNPTYLNSTILDDSDQFILRDDDRVRFGKTELSFKI